MRTVRSDRGETLIEFALAATVFFMMLLGTAQLGFAVWNYNTLASLAQDGARWAAVRGSACSCTQATNNLSGPDSVQEYVRGRSLGMSSTALTVTATWPDGGSPPNAPGKTVQVRVDYTFPLLTAIVRTGTLPLHGIAQMKIAR